MLCYEPQAVGSNHSWVNVKENIIHAFVTDRKILKIFLHQKNFFNKKAHTLTDGN